MTFSNNIIELAAYPRSTDPALAARQRMNTADGDNQYEAARIAFMGARPNTLAGILAKHEALGDMLESLRDGEELTSAAWGELLSLFDAVAGGLKSMTARVA